MPKPRSGTSTNAECWPIVVPPCCTSVTSPRLRSSQLMPTASPSALPGISTVGTRIERTRSADSSCSPASVRPSLRWKRAQASWSAVVADMPPAGLPALGSAHGRATLTVPSGVLLWPTAKRRVITSLGKKNVLSMPSGVSTSSCMACS